MRKEKILVTPERAKEFLKNNYHKNRPLRPSVVSQYATDISAGLWNEDISEIDNALAISEDGKLINGQHRCQAVILADKSIYIWAYFDVPIEMYEFFDGGAKRSAGDIIDLPNARNAAAVARVMYAIRYGCAPLLASINGKMKGGHPPIEVTRQQVVEFTKDNGDLVDRYTKLGERAKKYMGRNPNNLSIAFYLIDFVGCGDQLDRFVDECSSLAPTNDAVIACRSYMVNCLSSKNFRTDRKWMLACVLYTYEAFRDGRSISQFNKQQVTISKYDKYLYEARNSNKED